MTDRVWKYKCLFGYLHYFHLTIGEVVLTVKKVAHHLPNWTARTKDGKHLSRSDCWFETVDAAMDGAEHYADTLND